MMGCGGWSVRAGEKADLFPLALVRGQSAGHRDHGTGHIGSVVCTCSDQQWHQPEF